MYGPSSRRSGKATLVLIFPAREPANLKRFKWRTRMSGAVRIFRDFSPRTWGWGGWVSGADREWGRGRQQEARGRVKVFPAKCGRGGGGVRMWEGKSGVGQWSSGRRERGGGFRKTQRGGVGWGGGRRGGGTAETAGAQVTQGTGGFKTHQGMATCAATPVLVRAVQPL
jgi:hypothetical protein